MKSNWSTNVNLRLVSSNPIIKLLNIISAIVEFFLGIRRTGVLKVTDEHLVVESKLKIIWFFTKSETILKVAKDRISGIQIGSDRSFFIFKSNVCSVYTGGVSQPMTYAVQCSYDELMKQSENWMS